MKQQIIILIIILILSLLSVKTQKIEIQTGTSGMIAYNKPHNLRTITSGFRSETVTVSFPTPFSGTPKVILAVPVLDYSHSSGDGDFLLNVDSVSQSNFVYTISTSISGVLNTASIKWLAIIEKDTRIEYKQINTPNLDSSASRTSDLIQEFEIPYESSLVCPDGIQASVFLQGGKYIGGQGELRIRIKDKTHSDKIILEAIASTGQVKYIKAGVIASCTKNMEGFSIGKSTSFTSGSDNFSHTLQNNFVSNMIQLTGLSQYYSPDIHTKAVRIGSSTDTDFTDNTYNVRINTWNVSKIETAFVDGALFYQYDCIKGCKYCNNRDNCINCLDSSGRTGSDCQCTTPGQFDLTGNDICQDCTSPCDTCSGSADTCETCVFGHYKDGSTCTICPHPYKQCSDDTTPTECKTGTGRLTTLISNCQCDIANGYYEKNTADCGQCSSPCETCSGTQYNCGSCIFGYYRDGSTCTICPHPFKQCSDDTTPTECKTGTGRLTTLISNCQCDIANGYFEKNTDDCGQCASPCKTCSGTQNNCDSCIFGHYRDGSTCTACPHPFKQCSDNSAPTECKSGSGRLGTVDNCQCDISNGYFEKNTDDCGQCASPCETCSGTQDNCDSCIFGDYRDGNTCIPCPHPFIQCTDLNTPIQCKSGSGRLDTIQKCICDKDNGYFEKNTDDCGQCEYPCLTCTGTSTSCDSCVSGNRKSDGTCDCDTGFYEQGQLCQSCLLKFKDCSDQFIPTECHNDAIGRTIFLPCTCQDKYFDEGQKNCSECLDVCATCSNGDSCDTCVDPQKNPALRCTCPSIYYQDSRGICQACLPECQSCSNQTTCDSCKDPTKSPFFKCRDSCDLPCTSCDDNKNCQICQFGYVLINQVCEKCHPRCLTCSDQDPNTCILCKQGLENRKNEENCLCEQGFFENESTQECERCILSSCKSCDSKGDCLECRNQNLLPPSCQQNKNGKFKESLELEGGQVVFIEQRCSLKCEKCSNSFDNCETCVNGLNRLNQPPCSCRDGYHDENGINQNCQKCPVGCKTCMSSENCLECVEGLNRELNNFSNMCECKSGYKQDFQSDKCVKCFLYNQECLIECPDNTLKIEGKGVCQDITFYIGSNKLIFWVLGLSSTVLVLFIVLSMIYCSKKTNKEELLPKQSQIRQKIEN